MNRVLAEVVKLRLTISTKLIFSCVFDGECLEIGNIFRSNSVLF